MTNPIFADVFADQWEMLPLALRTHYANRPNSHDCVTVEGRLDIRIHPLMKPFAPLMAALGLLTPWAGEQVPCTVQFLSQPDGRAFIFDRRFRFAGRNSYQFRSELVAKGPHLVTEYMRCGVGWRCGYHFTGGRVVLAHKGYVWRLFGIDIPLPGAGLIVGHGEAWEEATGGDRFAMFMGLRHPLFGRLYSYSGTFTVTEIAVG
jgi:hypothetical protein